MGNPVKDVAAAVSNRIKSPVFGYIFLSFLAIHWKQIYYLMFADGNVTQILDHVTAGMPSFTSSWELLRFFGWYPSVVWSVFVGTFIAVISPWFSFVFAFVADIPTKLKEQLEIARETNVANLRVENLRIHDLKIDAQAAELSILEKRRDALESQVYDFTIDAETIEKQIKKSKAKRVSADDESHRSTKKLESTKAELKQIEDSLNGLGNLINSLHRGLNDTRKNFDEMAKILETGQSNLNNATLHSAAFQSNFGATPNAKKHKDALDKNIMLAIDNFETTSKLINLTNENLHEFQTKLGSLPSYA